MLRYIYNIFLVVNKICCALCVSSPTLLSRYVVIKLFINRIDFVYSFFPICYYEIY